MLILRRYRSATAYQFHEEQADAIAQTAAYHCRDYPLSVVWFSPREHVDVQHSLATPLQRSASVSLGSLDQLPVELLLDVLFYLDMYSLFKFRQINQRSRQVVDSLKQYQIVISHGLSSLCALLRTRLADSISLVDFYGILCTKACALCGEFGGFVFLPTWTRCCFACIRKAPETQVQTLASVQKQFKLTEVELDQLTPFKTLPGIYTMHESVYKLRTSIVSIDQVNSVRGQQTPDQPAGSERDHKYRFMASCALPYYNKRTGEADHGISCAGCQYDLQGSIYFVDSIFEALDKVYTRDGFLEHFRWCHEAQRLWNSSGEGNHRPSMLPIAVRNGGSFYKRE